MTASTDRTTNTQYFISEVSEIECNESLNFASYCLPPNLDLQVARKLSYRLSRHFPKVVVIWHKKIFHALTNRQGEMPSLDEWNCALKSIKQDLSIETSLGKLKIILIVKIYTSS